jgi:hypothetical protein
MARAPALLEQLSFDTATAFLRAHGGRAARR